MEVLAANAPVYRLHVPAALEELEAEQVLFEGMRVWARDDVHDNGKAGALVIAHAHDNVVGLSDLDDKRTILKLGIAMYTTLCPRYAWRSAASRASSALRRPSSMARATSSSMHFCASYRPVSRISLTTLHTHFWNSRATGLRDIPRRR